MTASEAMTALGLMNICALEHPSTGTDKIGRAKYIFFFLNCLLSDRRSYLFPGKQETGLYRDTVWKVQG